MRCLLDCCDSKPYSYKALSVTDVGSMAEYLFRQTDKTDRQTAKEGTETRATKWDGFASARRNGEKKNEGHRAGADTGKGREEETQARARVRGKREGSSQGVKG